MPPSTDHARADKRARDRRYNAKRPAWAAWYRTADWRQRAAAQLKAEPLCRFCAKAGVRKPATIADHIERHRGDAVQFFSGRLQSLCRHHHNSTKQSMERRDVPHCDVDGLPIDPSHPWGRT